MTRSVVTDPLEKRPLRVSVIVPARDEAERIGTLVRAVTAVFAGSDQELELIVVNDGSTDGTAAEARRASSRVRVLDLPSSRGKGGAIASGFAASSGDVVAFIDADLEYPPESLPDMVSAVAATEGRACAVGVRRSDQRSVTERMTSRLARAVIELVLRLGVSDTQAGIKAFPGSFARSSLTHSREHGWLFDVEALLLASLSGLSIIEVPVVQRPNRRRRAGLSAMIRCVPALIRLAARRWSPALADGEGARLVRYLLVGLTNTAIDMALFSALMVVYPPGREAWLGGLYAGAAWAVASVVAYQLHSRVTFRARLPIAGFYCVTLAGIVVQSGAAGAGTLWWGTPGAFVGKVAGIGLAAMVTYIGYRVLATRSPRVDPLPGGIITPVHDPSEE